MEGTKAWEGSTVREGIERGRLGKAREGTKSLGGEAK